MQTLSFSLVSIPLKAKTCARGFYYKGKPIRVPLLTSQTCLFVFVVFFPRDFRIPFKAPNLWAAQLRPHKRVCRFVLYWLNHLSPYYDFLCPSNACHRLFRNITRTPRINIGGKVRKMPTLALSTRFFFLWNSSLPCFSSSVHRDETDTKLLSPCCVCGEVVYCVESVSCIPSPANADAQRCVRAVFLASEIQVLCYAPNSKKCEIRALQQSRVVCKYCRFPTTLAAAVITIELSFSNSSFAQMQPEQNSCNWVASLPW